MSPLERRDFLKILGIGSAAGMAGCSHSAPDSLVTYVTPPEELVRGQALWYRTTCRECPAGCGLEVRVREGRVHKVEGNPLHPVNGGGVCARGQASVQGLYNPDRLRTPLAGVHPDPQKPVAWEEAWKLLLAGLQEHGPEHTVVVTGVVTGALAELYGALGRHIQFEPIAYESLREANRMCFGIAGLPVLRFADARAIHVFETDVIGTFVSPVGYARGIADARRGGGRLVYWGTRLSLAGARADQWIALEEGRSGIAAMALVREALAQGAGAHLGAMRERVKAWAEPFTAQRARLPQPLLKRLAQEMIAQPPLAVAGGAAGCDERALFTAVAVNLLNAVTGALNRTVRFDRASALDRLATRAQLDAELRSGRAIVFSGTNPAHAIPGLASTIRDRPFVTALAAWPDETTETAEVVLPVHSPLESWGDYEPWTGVHLLQQPAMRPIFETRDTGDVLIQLANATGRAKIAEPNFREYLRNRWRKLDTSSDFESFWRASLERGGYWRDVPDRQAVLKLEALPPLPELRRDAPYRLQVYPSIAHFDGRGANRPWLQELPDPITQVVWDSWVEINPADAARLGIATGDQVRVQSRHGSLETAAYVYPGIRPGSIAMPLGQGHTAFGRYATGIGANAARLLSTSEARWSGEPVRISLVAKARKLAIAAGHDYQENRGIARSRTTSSGPRPPGSGAVESEQSIYPPHAHPGHRWAMAIDLDACNGCSACVTACYAENNIPVVGKDQVARGRNMSWIRLERFFGPGSEAAQPLQIDFTLMLCQQCDKAPCESVCPVFASYHNAEGLNGQVYNRCVGTRYCANNCPYKTRRFNWYEGAFPAPLDWQLNPDVTVRSKGVMEKCTFCIQRIAAAKDLARREGRPLADGEVVPACAQSCPAGAIVFGDANDPRSRVAQALRNPRRYRVFEELNTRPAVHYLERERRV